MKRNLSSLVLTSTFSVLSATSVAAQSSNFLDQNTSPESLEEKLDPAKKRTISEADQNRIDSAVKNTLLELMSSGLSEQEAKNKVAEDLRINGCKTDDLENISEDEIVNSGEQIFVNGISLRMDHKNNLEYPLNEKNSQCTWTTTVVPKKTDTSVGLPSENAPKKLNLDYDLKANNFHELPVCTKPREEKSKGRWQDIDDDCSDLQILAENKDVVAAAVIDHVCLNNATPDASGVSGETPSTAGAIEDRNTRLYNAGLKLDQIRRTKAATAPTNNSEPSQSSDNSTKKEPSQSSRPNTPTKDDTPEDNTPKDDAPKDDTSSDHKESQQEAQSAKADADTKEDKENSTSEDCYNSEIGGFFWNKVDDLIDKTHEQAKKNYSVCLFGSGYNETVAGLEQKHREPRRCNISGLEKSLTERSPYTITPNQRSPFYKYEVIEQFKQKKKKEKQVRDMQNTPIECHGAAMADRGYRTLQEFNFESLAEKDKITVCYEGEENYSLCNADTLAPETLMPIIK